MRNFHARWRPMSQIKNFTNFLKVRRSGPGLTKQQPRPEPSQKFVSGFEKQDV